MTPIFKFAVKDGLDSSFLPKQSEPNATGWDVKSSQDLVVKSGQYVKIPLGIRSFCPEGWWYELKPRSSTFAKKNLHALYGTIDQDFHLELIFAAQYLPEDINSELQIKFGEPIGQIIPARREVMIVNEISNSEFDELVEKKNAVRKGGFGSTDGKK